MLFKTNIEICSLALRSLILSACFRHTVSRSHSEEFEMKPNPKIKAAPSASPENPHTRSYMAMAFITLLVFVVFGQNITFGYLQFDVPKIIFENPRIMSGLTPENIYWAFTSPNFGLFQPLPNISFMVDSDFFGAWPGGYHTVTLVWHALAMCLFFWVMFQLTGNFSVVFAATLIMSIHPLQILTVSQIATRHEIMQAVFALLSIEAYRRYVVHKSLRAYVFSLLFMVLGILCKQMIVVLPAVLLLLDYWPLGRVALSIREPLKTLRATFRLILEKTPYFALSVVGSALAVYGKSEFDLIRIGLEQMTLRETAYLVITGYARYVGHIFYPLRLGYFMVDEEQKTLVFFILSALLLLLLFVFVLTLLWKRPYLAVGWFWFVLFMLPASGVIRYMVESISLRYLYLPAMGLYLAFCFGLHDLSKWLQLGRTSGKSETPLGYWVVTGGLTLLLAGLSFWQHGFFRDTENMAQRVLAVTNNRSAFAHNMLGLVREDQGLYERCNAHFRESIAIAPQNILLRFFYADTLLRQGAFEEAIEIAEEALEIDPDHPDLLGLCGVAMMNLKKFKEAEQYLRHALEIEPDNTQVMHNLSYTMALLGNFAEAREMNKQVLLLNPDDQHAKALAEEINWSIKD